MLTYKQELQLAVLCCIIKFLFILLKIVQLEVLMGKAFIKKAYRP